MEGSSWLDCRIAPFFKAGDGGQVAGRPARPATLAIAPVHSRALPPAGDAAQPAAAASGRNAAASGQNAATAAAEPLPLTPPPRSLGSQGRTLVRWSLVRWRQLLPPSSCPTLRVLLPLGPTGGVLPYGSCPTGSCPYLPSTSPLAMPSTVISFCMDHEEVGACRSPAGRLSVGRQAARRGVRFVSPKLSWKRSQETLKRLG